MASNKDLLIKMYRYGIDHLTHNESLVLMKIASYVADCPHVFSNYIQDNHTMTIIVTTHTKDIKIVIGTTYTPHLFIIKDKDKEITITHQDINVIYELVEKELGGNSNGQFKKFKQIFRKGLF